MKNKLLTLALAAVLSSGLLVGCAGNQNMNERPEDVTYEPTRYDNNDMNYDNNMYDNQRGMDKRKHIRQSGERDTPYNMDEEEPDLDEEPSEERRGK